MVSTYFFVDTILYVTEEFLSLNPCNYLYSIFN